jgi:hypothetical protein
MINQHRFFTVFRLVGVAGVCARLRVYFRSCATSRARVDIRAHTCVCACLCNEISHELNSCYEHLLYESSRWKPG